MNVFDRYVGIPYLARGRDLNGIDCWGLVRLVFAEQLNIDLPSMDESYVSVADARAIAGLIEGKLPSWGLVKRSHERPFDVALMRVGREVCHIGLVVGAGLVLHAEQSRMSIVERMTSPRLSHRIVGFYRYISA